jgi:hypothetical protein
VGIQGKEGAELLQMLRVPETDSDKKAKNVFFEAKVPEKAAVKIDRKNHAQHTLHFTMMASTADPDLRDAFDKGVKYVRSRERIQNPALLGVTCVSCVEFPQELLQRLRLDWCVAGASHAPPRRRVTGK